MAISYNAGTNTLTLDGVNTYTLENIYQADVAGGWGVVTKVGEMYLFMCHLVVGDVAENATKLIDSNVGFQLGVTSTRKTFATKAGSSFEMTGCILKFWVASQKISYGSWKFDNCSIYSRETINNCLSMNGSQDHKRSEFDVNSWKCASGDGSFDRCLITATSYFYYMTSGIINDLRIEGKTKTFWTSPTFRNSVLTGSYELWHAELYAIMINSVFSNLIFNHTSNYLLDKWEFNVLVIDKNNNPLVASVMLRNKNGTIKHSAVTGADGKLPSTWEVLANRYDGTSETKTEYNPFTLTVTKTGYEDYETKVTIDHIVKDDQIVLVKKKRRGKLRLC